MKFEARRCEAACAVAAAASALLSEPGSIDHRPRGRALGHAVVGERLVDRRRRLGVVDLAQVAEHLRPGLGARAGARRRARKSELATSLPPPLPKIEPMKAKPAMASVSLARGQLGPGLGRASLVGVDAVDPVLQVAQHLAALRAGAPQHVLLLGDEVDRLLARGERAGRGDEAEGVDAGHVERGQVGRPEPLEQEQPAILGGHPSGAEHHVGARAPVDVRDVVAVAEDLSAPAARSARGEPPAR